MPTSIIRMVQLVTAGLLEAVLLPDGQQGATLRSLCALLQIDRQAQMQRIKRNRGLSAGLVLVEIDLPDGARTLSVVLSNYIALFVATLQVSRLSPVAQEAALILQTKAVQTIASAFDTSPMAAETPTTFAAPTTRETEVIPSHPFDRIIEGMEEITEGLRQVRTDYSAMEQRITILEQDRLGRRVGSGARLSAAQVGQLFMQLALLREQTGISIEDAEKRLADQFGVAHIIDIDASEWPTVHQAILALFRR
jgi:hypothetical protein